jgi:NADPH:quinone reductase-like Zn-dependent oxidoreductase
MRVMELSGDWGLDHVKLGQRAEPVPGPGQILLKMEAASLNYRDLVVVRRGYGRFSGTLPFILLSDGAGRVIATGPGVSRVAPGDLVCPIVAPGWISGPLTAEQRDSRLGATRDGVMSELMLVEAEDVVKAPEHFSARQAATLPCAALTAWNAVTAAGVGPGDLVVTQGTGGVSLFALQFAAALGARVFITSASDEKLARAMAMGAAGGINYRRTPDWARELLRATGGRNADLVIDVAGANSLGQSLRAVRVSGTIALIGVLSGATAELELGRVVTQAIRLQGVTLGSRNDFEQMVAAIERHKLVPAIDARRFAFTEVAAAIAAIAEGRHFGKICIDFQAG